MVTPIGIKSLYQGGAHESRVSRPRNNWSTFTLLMQAFRLSGHLGYCMGVLIRAGRATELMSHLSFMPKENMGLDLDTLVELGHHSQAGYEGGVLSHQGQGGRGVGAEDFGDRQQKGWMDSGT